MENNKIIGTKIPISNSLNGFDETNEELLSRIEYIYSDKITEANLKKEGLEKILNLIQAINKNLSSIKNLVFVLTEDGNLINDLVKISEMISNFDVKIFEEISSINKELVTANDESDLELIPMLLDITKEDLTADEVIDSLKSEIKQYESKNKTDVVTRKMFSES